MEIKIEKISKGGVVYNIGDNTNKGVIEKITPDGKFVINGHLYLIDKVEKLIELDILSEAIHKFGIEHQLKMVQEECLELALSIHRFVRGRCAESDVVDEIADVKIMVRQAEIIFSKYNVEKRVKYKLERLGKNVRGI